MRRGEIVTPAALLARFKNLFLKLNALTQKDFRQLSTGQIFIISTEGVHASVMSTSCEQSFDSPTEPSYKLYETLGNKTYGGNSRMKNLLEEITELENR